MDQHPLETIAHLATAAGVLIAAFHIYDSKRQARAAFEDQLVEQYRKISRRIPLPALLGHEVDAAKLETALRSFYEYFDLSNEQAFLYRRKRITKGTWQNWRDGISQHLARPAFQQAWLRLQPDLDGSFDDLRSLFPRELGATDR